MTKKMNVYDKARGVARDIAPLLQTIREYDKSLADQLKRAAQSVVLVIARFTWSQRLRSRFRST